MPIRPIIIRSKKKNLSTKITLTETEENERSQSKNMLNKTKFNVNKRFSILRINK
jgi:hypothetical protein